MEQFIPHVRMEQGRDQRVFRGLPRNRSELDNGAGQRRDDDAAHLFGDAAETFEGLRRIPRFRERGKLGHSSESHRSQNG